MPKIKLLNIVFCFLLIHCASSKIGSRDQNNIPEWVITTPFEKDNLYAAGMVGPTFLPEDGKRFSADDARKELAKSVSGRVQSVLLYVNESGRTRISEAYIVEATSWATDFVLSGSTILSHWVDKDGIVPNGTKGATYALCVIPINNILSGMEKSLINIMDEKQKKETIEDLKKSFQKKIENLL